MPMVFDWSPSTETDELVRHVRGTLLEGQVAILPSRSGYVVAFDPASAGAAQAVAALEPLGVSPPAILSFGPDDPAGLGLDVPRQAARMMERVWPGPLTVALPVPETLARPQAWSADAWAGLTADGHVRFRSPDHPLFDALLPALEFPAFVVDSYRPAADDLVKGLGDRVGIVVSAGDLNSAVRPTTVGVGAKSWKILDEGVIPASDVEKLTARIVLFVCTGNTCRSPMAEALAKRLLANQLGCAVDELPSSGYWIMSAGVAAYGGDPPSAGAVEVVRAYGADLSEHQSRPVNPQILAAADDVVAMTQSHAAALASRYPGYGPPARLLCGDDDLTDPIGGDETVYRECARTIHTHLERLVRQWVAT